jgi:hypothetical protein
VGEFVVFDEALEVGGDGSEVFIGEVDGWHGG